MYPGTQEHRTAVTSPSRLLLLLLRRLPCSKTKATAAGCRQTARILIRLIKLQRSLHLTFDDDYLGLDNNIVSKFFGDTCCCSASRSSCLNHLISILSQSRPAAPCKKRGAIELWRGFVISCSRADTLRDN